LRRLVWTAIAFAAAVAAGSALAQPSPLQPPAAARPSGGPPPPAPAIGAPISLEDAKLVAAAAQVEAKKRNFTATIAVVDPGGELVYYEKATGAPYTSEAFAMRKAKSAARNRRSTKYDADRLANGVAILPYVPEMFPFAGGEPILKDGKVIGGIGVTGGLGDGEIAVAGAKAIK
jgi:glc operon protein GlcG